MGVGHLTQRAPLLSTPLSLVGNRILGREGARVSQILRGGGGVQQNCPQKSQKKVRFRSVMGPGKHLGNVAG